MFEPKKKVEDSYQTQNFRKIDKTSFLYKKSEKEALESTPKRIKNAKVNEDILLSPTTPSRAKDEPRLLLSPRVEEAK